MSMNDYSLMKKIERGGFGKVMLVQKRNGADAGAIYAMKIIEKSLIQKHRYVMDC